jgi:hypothetical protein
LQLKAYCSNLLQTVQSKIWLFSMLTCNLSLNTAARASETYNLFMKNISTNSFAIVFLLIAATHFCAAQNMDSINHKKLEGRWDITIMMDGKEVPSWLQVSHSGIKTLVGYFVGSGGSARPISEVKMTGTAFNFAIPPQWEQEDRYMEFQGRIEGDGLKGDATFPNGKTYSWTAARAPSLRSEKKITWGKPVHLLDQNSLKGWKAIGASNQWVVENGVLKSPKSGANLVTEEKFNDFKLHIEFRYPKGSNSGVYLRGRYEVQVMDSKGNEPLPGELGGIYGFISPAEQVAKAPGEWQTYDITLIGRMVTVEANGKLIICNQEIPGITGGALDSKEGEPGPFMLQGDHGPVEYRNIVVTPAK